MLPVAKKASIRHPPLGGESSQETNVTATWSQRHITEFPPEVLSHIFACLGCDDIVQVHDTCRLFRRVVLMEHAQAFFYRELPQRFREQFQQSRLWQEQTILNGQHPFTTAARGNKNRFFDTGQHTALMCFRTLGNMLSTSVYRPVKVFSSPLGPCALSVDFSLNSANLVLYSLSGRWATVLGPDEAGSWSEQTVDLGERGGWLMGLYCGFRNGRVPPSFGSHNTIKYLRRDDDHGRWQLVSPQWLKASDVHEISPSGKYLAIFTHTGGLKDIRCLDDQGQWILMPIGESARIYSRIRVLQFSPSGERLAIRYEKVLTVMSPDSQGCWNSTWTDFSEKRTTYMEFCPSERWLLVGCWLYQGVSCSADIIRLDPAGRYLSRQEIDCKNYQLTFSPAGNYLLSQQFRMDNQILWQLLKSGNWVFYGDLVNPEASPLAIEETDLKIDIIKISPCDNYLLISSCDGVVIIWGRDAQGDWKVCGREQHDSPLVSVEFSQSGFHVLTVDWSSIRIWGRDKDGSWFVKGVVRVGNVWSAHFLAVAEHLIVFRNLEGIQVWEVRKDD